MYTYKTWLLLIMLLCSHVLYAQKSVAIPEPRVDNVLAYFNTYIPENIHNISEYMRSFVSNFGDDVHVYTTANPVLYRFSTQYANVVYHGYESAQLIEYSLHVASILLPYGLYWRMSIQNFLQLFHSSASFIQKLSTHDTIVKYRYKHPRDPRVIFVFDMDQLVAIQVYIRPVPNVINE